MMTPKKALVVDDSRSARYSLRKTLERMEIAVDCVESGETALSYLQSAKEGLPDIIFMDNLMPGLSGLDTTETIHQNTHWRHIPVIMCTAMQQPAQSEAQQSTAAGFLPKPATSNQIQALLSTLSPNGRKDDIRKDDVKDGESNTATQHTAPEKPAESTPNATTQIHTPNTQTSDTPATTTRQPKNQTVKKQNPPEQASLIQGTTPPKVTPETAALPSLNSSETRSRTTHSAAPATPGATTSTTTTSTTTTPANTALEGSLDALIDQLQGQLNGIEPRLLSLESAKHTLDSAIHQRLTEMHDQLVAHVHQLIDEAIAKHESPNLDTEVLKTHIAATLDAVFPEKIQPVQNQLREELDAQSRHIEHRLMGEVVETDHVIEQASAAASKVAVANTRELIADAINAQASADNERIESLISDAEQNLIQRAELAAENAALKAAAREAEKIACQQAEKAVSDNLNRLQRQISQSAQAQINSAVKKQQVMGLAGFGIAVIALVLSIVL